MSYFVYIVRCSDDTFYTGICTNISRRITEHNGPYKGARYTRARQPVTLVYQEEQPNRSSAQKREHAIRTLSRDQKEKLINTSK